MITAENYFSPENNMKYMSASQFKSFMDCEAKTVAKLRGEHEDEETTALLVGSYVDAHFEKTLDLFKAKNPQLFTKSGDLKSEYKHAEYIIERIERDEMFMKYMSGEKQVIMTGEISGIPFKVKIDSYHPGKCITDLKIMKDFKPIYVEGQGRVSFIEAWKYDVQGAIYRAIEGNNLPFFIAAATKEKPEPDIAIFRIEDEYLEAALNAVKEYAPRFQAIKQGEVEPLRCGRCDYCKRTKVLDRVIGLEELNYE